ncbi:MAG: hypothetical protein ACJA2S_002303 [Cyclobacteriaceae bacterium]|jgi:hypothetical protein
MSQYNELRYLKLICSQIEQRLSWGAPKGWTNSSFIEFGNEVKRASGVRISADTLKRIFGKVKTAEQYNPQLATKDALSVFLAYESWSDFKLKNKLPQDEVLVVPSSSPEVIDITPKNRFLWLVPLVVFSVLIFLFIFKPTVNPPPIDYSFFPFSIKGKYLEGNAYHTAIFDYCVKSIPTDSIFLSFGDVTRKQLLKKDNKTISHYYRGPGKYEVKLFAEQQVLYDTTVYLRTDDWEAYTFFSKGDVQEYLPIYDFQDSISEVMSVNANVPKIKGIDTTQMYWIQYCNYQKYGQNGDNFVLETEVMNNQEIISARCNHVKIDITGENSSISIYFLREGCSKWVKLQFGDVYLNGETQDLSAFGKDFLDFQKVTIRNENKKVRVFYNETLLIEQPYQNSLGEIVGISYTFSGVGGAVKSSELRNIFLKIE